MCARVSVFEHTVVCVSECVRAYVHACVRLFRRTRVCVIRDAHTHALTHAFSNAHAHTW